jgi:hypothetical protein
LLAALPDFANHLKHLVFTEAKKSIAKKLLFFAKIA